MKDFSSWDEYEGSAEGSGRSEKKWLINPDTKQIGLFKYKKDLYTTDDVSECMAYDLACRLDIPCAKFELGLYQGRQGSISYNILDDSNKSLIEGINYIVSKYPSFSSSLFVDEESKAHYSIEMIRESLDGVIDFKDFLMIPVFDYLIGNTDRHYSNWAVIHNSKDDSNTLSPLYDNSSSLCAYMSSKKMEMLYGGNDKNQWRALVVTKSKSIIRRTNDDSKPINHYLMMEYLRNNYYDCTKDLVDKIIDLISADFMDIVVDRYSDAELNLMKKDIIKRFVNQKVDDLKNIYR